MSEEIKVQFRAVIDFTVECMDSAEVTLAKTHLPHDFTRLVGQLHGDGHLGGDHEFCVTKAVLTSFDEEVRRGFRLFVCPDCREVSILATRDRTSPSSENCPCCAADMHPCRSWSDHRLPVDTSGNLTLPAGVLTLGDFERWLEKPAGSWLLVGDDTEYLDAAGYTEALEEAISPSVVIFRPDGPLAVLCERTGTKQAEWKITDGPDSRCGVDLYFQHTDNGTIWRVNDDQGAYTVEQMSGDGDE